MHALLSPVDEHQEPRRTMFSPYQLPFLIRYFDGIDLALSRRLLRKVPPSEPTLTAEFCALMDADTQAREGLLAFDARALNAALSAHGEQTDIDFKIDTHQHGMRMEAYVSQADFGLVLEYRNSILPGESWSAAYLMQAKRLFPDTTGTYGVNSAFASIAGDQALRMHALAAVLGEEAIRYCLYCPPTPGYDPGAVAAIRTLHARNLSRHIFDFALGLALHDEVRQVGGIDAGIWIANAGHQFPTAVAMHSSAFVHAHSLTWFILAHFGRRGAHRPALHSTHSELPSAVDRVRDIACGDARAAQALIDELGESARKKGFDPGTMRVLPANTVTVSIRVGPVEGEPLRIAIDDDRL